MSFLTKLLGGATKGATTASTRSVAKERLSVILASQRGSELLEGICMEDLQRDVLKVVERHIAIAKNKKVNFSVNSEGETQLFEMSIELGQAATSRRNAVPNNTTTATTSTTNKQASV